MKRVVVHEFGGPEQLTVESAAQPPVPGPGEFLVDVEAAGINYLDVYQRKGLRKLPLPFTPGLEGVGRVRQLGGDPSDAAGTIRVGQRVAWINVSGSSASFSDRKASTRHAGLDDTNSPSSNDVRTSPRWHKSNPCLSGGLPRG